MTCSVCKNDHSEGRAFEGGSLCPSCMERFRQEQKAAQSAFEALPEEERVSNLEPLTVVEWIAKNAL